MEDESSSAITGHVDMFYQGEWQAVTIDCTSKGAAALICQGVGLPGGALASLDKAQGCAPHQRCIAPDFDYHMFETSLAVCHFDTSTVAPYRCEAYFGGSFTLTSVHSDGCNHLCVCSACHRTCVGSGHMSCCLCVCLEHAYLYALCRHCACMALCHVSTLPAKVSYHALRCGMH